MKIYRSRRYGNANHATRRIFAYGIVSIIILFILGVWGVTLLANLSNFWDSVRGSTTTAPTKDTVAPPPPFLYSLSTYTTTKKVTVSGSAEPGSTLTLSKDGTALDTQLVGNDGQFSFHDLALKEGSNSFTAKAKDAAGNESAVSNSVAVILDTIPPKLTVDTPANGMVSSTQFLTVSGKTESKAVVTVNGIQQIVADDGTFSGVATLSAGDNQITVTSNDQAGNQTKVVRTVTYNPS